MKPLPLRSTQGQVKIGAKLRASRLTQGLTLEQLANASGLSRGFVSRVENDATSPSIASLVQLCQVLSLPVGDLFADEESQLVTLATAPIINLGGDGVTEHLLTGRSESRAQLVRSTAAAHATGGLKLYTVNCELEILHLLSGSITVDFTSKSFDLTPGDTLTFSGHDPHTWRAHEHGAEIMWTLIPAAWSGTT